MTAVPLKIRARCVLDFPTIKQHVISAVAREIPVFTPTTERHDLEAVLVGSGPSVKTQIETIRALKGENTRIFGIKAGHDFLLEHNIEPDFGLAVDPQERIAEENFNKDCDATYFIATQCHPALFDKMADKKCVAWHLQTNNLMKFQQEDDSPIKGHFMVAGGSTSGLRAIVLAWHMGFRKCHLFGFDSCLSGDLRKINGEKCDKDTLTVTVGVRDFVADKAFASQANEFPTMINQFNGEMKFKPYGDGLIQHICRERYRKGAPDIFV